jgi:membrane associated rhomboid family serine protease
MIRQLLIALGAAFAVQTFLQLFGLGNVVAAWLALSSGGLFSRFAFWQVVTYGFLHGGLWHLLFNMLGIYMFGADVERVLGSRGLLRYFLVCVVGGGVAFVILDLLSGRNALVVGASAGVLGVVIAFAVFFPNRQVFLFPLPFPIKARTMALLFAVFNLYGAITSNSAGGPGGSAVAFGAHLGGMAIGYAYLMHLRRPGGLGGMFGRRRSRFRVIDGDGGNGDRNLFH